MKSSNYLRQAKRRGQHLRKSEGEDNHAWQDKILGKYQLTLALGINRAQLDSWIKQGMPVTNRGNINKEWEFDLVAVRSWAKAHGYKVD
ncbi:MAG: hypothetical protein HWE27_03495 [Gammaproteobacteria bacterium]|nr:hypothetical protein [Gammaproteobacteria bacterium]